MITITLGYKEAQLLREVLCYYSGQMAVLHPSDQNAINRVYTSRSLSDRIFVALNESEDTNNG